MYSTVDYYRQKGG